MVAFFCPVPGLERQPPVVEILSLQGEEDVRLLLPFARHRRPVRLVCIECPRLQRLLVTLAIVAD
jgi:hypothetical protein